MTSVIGSITFLTNMNNIKLFVYSLFNYDDKSYEFHVKSHRVDNISELSNTSTTNWARPYISKNGNIPESWVLCDCSFEQLQILKEISKMTSGHEHTIRVSSMRYNKSITIDLVWTHKYIYENLSYAINVSGKVHYLGIQKLFDEVIQGVIDKYQKLQDEPDVEITSDKLI